MRKTRRTGIMRDKRYWATYNLNGCRMIPRVASSKPFIQISSKKDRWKLNKTSQICDKKIRGKLQTQQNRRVEYCYSRYHLQRVHNIRGRKWRRDVGQDLEMIQQQRTVARRTIRLSNEKQREKGRNDGLTRKQKHFLVCCGRSK